MRQLLLGCLILLTACQPTAAPTTAAPLFPTAPFSPTPAPVTVTPELTATCWTLWESV